MAINSFSLEYIETFRVCVSDNGVPTENATAQVTGCRLQVTGYRLVITGQL